MAVAVELNDPGGTIEQYDEVRRWAPPQADAIPALAL